MGYNSGKPDTTVQIFEGQVRDVVSGTDTLFLESLGKSSWRWHLRPALKDGEDSVIEPSRQKEQWDQVRDTHVHAIWGTTQNRCGCFTMCMGWMGGVRGAEATLGLHCE